MSGSVALNAQPTNSKAILPSITLMVMTFDSPRCSTPNASRRFFNLATGGSMAECLSDLEFFWVLNFGVVLLALAGFFSAKGCAITLAGCSLDSFTFLALSVTLTGFFAEFTLRVFTDGLKCTRSALRLYSRGAVLSFMEFRKNLFLQAFRAAFSRIGFRHDASFGEVLCLEPG